MLPEVRDTGPSVGLPLMMMLEPAAEVLFHRMSYATLKKYLIQYILHTVGIENVNINSNAEVPFFCCLSNKLRI
jgi:hypothetical protein